ncbi:biotin-dependent carboxyltransferase family protein [Roseovarius sp. SYSU LYC5161]|uniref:5-oxoprolinase subunit C family protein n=1 Tax=Roseovarius halophilus (ex Wu et al. 2025) TaxID=3376060 RepID=UPI00399A8AB6
MIRIVTAGPLASVQDLGRRGYRSLGVGTAGAMDLRALRAVNALVGNDEGAAAIEFTLGGFAVEAMEDVDIAVGGASADLKIDGSRIAPWWTQTLRRGQFLTAGHSVSGMRIYLAVGGGIDVPLLMGARSTDLKGGFGGLEGRTLRDGDTLATGTAAAEGRSTGFGLSFNAYPQLFSPLTSQEPLRFVPAAEWEDYDAQTQACFTESDWTVTTESNRVGYRLGGPVLEAGERRELLSHGILPGTIQLPHGGAPVVQMREANTCGGYPKLGVVIEADLHRLAQVPLGRAIRFAACTPAEGRAAAQSQEVELAAIARQSARARNGWAA